jgi:hypothetical protein
MLALVTAYTLLVNRYLKKEQMNETTATKAYAGSGAASGMREDYLRGYYVGTERQPNGLWEDSYGYRSRIEDSF